jgi:hypothetical protein
MPVARGGTFQMGIRTIINTQLIMGLFSFFGCSKPKRSSAPLAAEQTVSLPSAADLEQLAKQRAIVERYLGDDDSREKYKSAAGKLGLLRALLTQNVFKPTQTYELQCMGVVLGDVFVQELGMEWVTVADEHGTTPAVRMPSSSIIIYPLTMISKRVERGEKVDVFEIFNGLADQIDHLKGVAK